MIWRNASRAWPAEYTSAARSGWSQSRRSGDARATRTGKSDARGFGRRARRRGAELFEGQGNVVRTEGCLAGGIGERALRPEDHLEHGIGFDALDHGDFRTGGILRCAHRPERCRNVARGADRFAGPAIGFVGDETVVDANEPAVASVTHALPKPDAIHRGELFGRGRPGTFDVDLQQGSDGDQGAGLVDRGQTQVVKEPKPLRADDRHRDSLLPKPASPRPAGRPRWRSAAPRPRLRRDLRGSRRRSRLHRAGRGPRAPRTDQSDRRSAPHRLPAPDNHRKCSTLLASPRVEG